MDHPKYHVSWIQDHCCGSCSHKSKQKFTFAFFNPENAMELASTIIKNGHTLLYVEQ